MKIGNMVSLSPEEWNKVEIVLGYSWAMIAHRDEMSDRDYEVAKERWLHYMQEVNHFRELEVPYDV